MRVTWIFAFALAAQPASVQQARAQVVCVVTQEQTQCNAVAQHAQMAQAGAGIAFAGGNPVPGASSTLGMRIGKIPRMTAALRATGGYMNLQSVRTETAGDDEKGFVGTINLDAAVGILSGWSIAPTIGGFASLDLIGSIGRATLPDEFSETGNSWAVGARVGILRESFTAPGVSVTGMYRSIGDMRYNTTEGCELDACDVTYALTDNSVTSVRAVVGKRLFVLGANAGIGYDRFSSEAEAMLGSTGFGWELEQDRFTGFANIAWTMLLLHIVVEGGFQRGNGVFEGPLPPPYESRTENSTYYGTLAIRLAL